MDATFEVVPVVRNADDGLPLPDVDQFYGLWNPRCKTFIRMPSAADSMAHHPHIDQSSPIADKQLPTDWTWEQFVIVSASDAMIAFQEEELTSLKSTVNALQTSLQSLTSQLGCITSETADDNLSCTLRPRSPLVKLELTA